MRNGVLERLILIKYHKLEVGRFHSLAFLQLRLSEFSIFLTGFPVLERAVGVDIQVITVRVVKIVIFNTLKHQPVSLASPDRRDQLTSLGGFVNLLKGRLE